MQHISCSVGSNAVATITLHNPPQNRLSIQTIDELSAAIERIAAEKARAVILRADGPDFSFGGDIMDWPDTEDLALRDRFDRYMNVFNALERLPVPVIAAVQGLCFGGGFELALRADLIFAAAGSRFGHPEQTLGIVTVLGGIYRVAERAGRARAMEWALTSEQVPATTMERFGVINRVIPDEQLLTETQAFAEQIAKGPTRAHAAHKALLRAWALGGVRSADELMFDVAMPLFKTDDVKRGLVSAVGALKQKLPRPVMDFRGE